ncbi:MAG: hypothetical protein K2X90_01520 [Candidatus Babeliaceae bacterium]|nr:hypothetical protein [Candidatus Babeliaceae bacterium]
MIIQKFFFLSIFVLSIMQIIYALPLAEQLKIAGYLEICTNKNVGTIFDSLYASYDKFIEFLTINPSWAQKLYRAKERFIRSKVRNYYSTDFFGFYDESQRKGRNQISFYYSTHFHDFLCFHYPEFKSVPEIIHFLEICFEIQKPCGNLFQKAAAELGLENIFSCAYGQPPILLKVVKYFSSYNATKPHYDGTAFSLFLHSTDNQSLLFSPYKSLFSVDDFSSPFRSQDSILLIPGVHLIEFSIFPTPHIVLSAGKTRYATIAFAMRPDYVPQKYELPSLPHFNY